MITYKYNKVAAGVLSSLLLLTSYTLTSCADLDYTEETTRDEAWTYEYFNEGIKGLVSGIYAQVYTDQFASNSAFFLAGATDEAQYALESGAVNTYINGGWSPANPNDRLWTKSYTAIADANMFLEKLDQADISEWKYNPNYGDWVAQLELFPYEVRFLRAYYYFELFKAYGDVPLVTTTLTNAQANSVERILLLFLREVFFLARHRSLPPCDLHHRGWFRDRTCHTRRCLCAESSHTALCCITAPQPHRRQDEMGQGSRGVQVHSRQC